VPLLRPLLPQLLLPLLLLVLLLCHLRPLRQSNQTPLSVYLWQEPPGPQALPEHLQQSRLWQQRTPVPVP
jgi:hypothetical protein